MSAARTLSEHESKRLLVEYGLPVPSERIVDDPLEAVAAAEAIGYPVVAKLAGDAIAHKTERGLVRTRNRIVNQRGETVIEYLPQRLMAGSRE